MLRGLLKRPFGRRRDRSVADRAAMLRLLVCAHSAEPNVNQGEALSAFCGMTLEPELEAIFHLRPSPDDLALADACLRLEREIRARQWSSLESTLSGFDEDGDHHWPESPREIRAAALCIYDIGWLMPAPTTETGGE